jgi:hypothetical protein
MSIEEREEVEAKGIHNILNKITENFSNLEKVFPIQVSETSRTTNRLDQNRTSPWHIITKTTSKDNKKKNIEGSKRENTKIYKGKSIKITVDFSTETLKARKGWSEVFWTLNENNFSPRILYSAKLSFKIDGSIKIFNNKQKLNQCMTTKLPQTILQGILHREDESKQNHERTRSIKPQKKNTQVIRRVVLIQLHTIKCLSNKNN